MLGTIQCKCIMEQQIKTGDVLLVSSNRWISKAIKWFTKSEWSHAGVFIQIWGEWYIIEAEKRGIQLTKWEDPSKYDGGRTTKKKLALLKPKRQYLVEEKKLANFVLPYAGTEPYDYIGLLVQAWFQLTGKWVGKTKEKAEKRMYCSEFVAFVYHHFNQKTFFDWWLISPAALSKVSYFTTHPINY